MEEHILGNPSTILAGFDATKPPKFISSLELASCCRSAKWNSDGAAILTTCDDRSLKIWTPQNFSVGMSEIAANEEPPSILSSQTPTNPLHINTFPHADQTKSFRQGSPIYDVAWYPFATPTQPAGYCFIASIRDAPVKLLDAGDGRIRASYRIVDHRERFVAPHSLAFNLSGQRFYCGFLDAIEVFDLNSPGEGTRLLTIPTKKSKDGLRGIISSLSFCPDFSGLYAAGTFNSSIGMFSEDTGADVLMYLDGISGPISHASRDSLLQFHPTNPRLLYAACRNRKDILVWDVRNATHLYSSLDLTSSSNQRRRFDIDSSGGYLAAGDATGGIRIYDIGTTQNELPVLSFDGHEDAVSNATFHPTQPHLLTVSGSYRFSSPSHKVTAMEMEDSSAGSSTDEDGNEAENVSGRSRSVKLARTRIGTSDSSMKVWEFGPA